MIGFRQKVNARQTIRLELPGELRLRHVALRTVSAACGLVPNDGVAQERVRSFRDDLVSAVGEAFNNIALHGYDGEDAESVQIEVDILATGLEIEIRDFGRSFDPRTAQPPPLVGMPESGLGVFIMKSLVDEVDYHPGRPNTLRLIKRLAA